MCVRIPFLPETPRFLINHGKSKKALENLTKLRMLDANHPYVQIEYREMQAQVQFEQESRQGHGLRAICQDIFLDASNRRRLFLAVMLFLFHKLTGTDALNYYAPSIFPLIGVKGNSTTLLATARSIRYHQGGHDAVLRGLPRRLGRTPPASPCRRHGPSQRDALLGPVHPVRRRARVSLGRRDPCGIVGVVAIYLYSFGWSFGHSVACYVVAAGIFPTRIRSVCMAFCFFVNWIIYYGITTATPHMLENMLWGTFVLYAGLTYLGVAFIFLCLPEIKDRSIESMDDLFKRSLWVMWRHAYPTDEEKVLLAVQSDLGFMQAEKSEAAAAAAAATGTVTHTEKV
ncbi:MFS transporter SP family solute carrier family 2 (myo-inositol transporter) member 13 [Microdochium nivale]|nr:MFS transporter SP family solute carrier family 2 (myo-inositol transporter) member 13 [Microdochium nivale]